MLLHFSHFQLPSGIFCSDWQIKNEEAELPTVEFRSDKSIVKNADKYEKQLTSVLIRL